MLCRVKFGREWAQHFLAGLGELGYGVEQIKNRSNLFEGLSVSSLSEQFHNEDGIREEGCQPGDQAVIMDGAGHGSKATCHSWYSFGEIGFSSQEIGTSGDVSTPSQTLVPGLRTVTSGLTSDSSGPPLFWRGQFVKKRAKIEQ